MRKIFRVSSEQATDWKVTGNPQQESGLADALDRANSAETPIQGHYALASYLSHLVVTYGAPIVGWDREKEPTQVLRDRVGRFVDDNLTFQPIP